MKNELTKKKFKSASRLAVYSKSTRIGFIALIASATSAWAGTAALEGVVKGPTGLPNDGADVRVEAGNMSKIVKTNSRGHFICDGLPPGIYKVTLIVNGSVKASIPNAKMRSGKNTQLNFNLTEEAAPTKKRTHMVYIHPDVDTHIGGGRWVEVDENGNIAGGNSGAGSNVETIAGTAVQQTVIRTKVQNPGKSP